MNSLDRSDVSANPDRLIDSVDDPAMATDRDARGSANRDPISGTPGAHPLGTGLGAAAGGAAAGAAAGTVAGPVGTLVGAAVGAIVGGLAGKAVAEQIDPTVEDTYWRENYRERPYVAGTDAAYEDYGPAYRHGVDAYRKNPDTPYEQAEPDLERDWVGSRGASSLDWDRAKHATRDAWQRASDKVERAIPGDSDRDGK